jgi:hypothetical protein
LKQLSPGHGPDHAGRARFPDRESVDSLEAGRRILIIAGMNCPKCGTPAQGAGQYCKRCGSALAAKAKTAAAAEPASSGEIDLMPLETEKPAYSAYEPPPGLDPGGAAPPGPAGPGGPPSPDAQGKTKIRGAMSAPKTLPINAIVGGAVGLILLVTVGWMMFRTKNEVKVGKPKVEKAYMVNVGQLYVEDIEVTGVVPYTLEVTVTEGEVLIGVMKRNPKDPKKLDVLKGSGELEAVKKGDSRTFNGEFKGKEQWSWVLANETKKPARLKVKFQTQP